MPLRAASCSTFLAAIALALPARASETHKAEPFVGVTHYQIVQSAESDARPPVLPRPMVVNIIEIDTTAPGIKFEMSPGNGDKPGEVTRGTTRAYLDRIGAQIGCNVGFYDTKAKYGGLDTDLMHLAASDGDVFSKAGGGEWVFDVSKEGHPRIAKADGTDSETIDKGTKVYNAGGGNQPMLHDGEVVTPDNAYTKALNPHTAVGVSKDKTKVYLVTVDGRQNGYSEGMRTDEMAKLMRTYGAWDAINFDGGGSTTLAIDDTDDGKADSRLLNSPSDNSSPAKPGTDRVVANSLAVFAKFNPKYVALAPVPRPKVEDGLALLTARTVIDDFAKDAGHFAGPLTASGSTKSVGAGSSATFVADAGSAAAGSVKVTIVADAASKDDFQLRLLSGDASPKTNAVAGKAMGNDGFVGVYLKREAGKGPLFVSLVVDDGTPNATGTERGASREVPDDGVWHLYEWGLNEDAKWTDFNGGNGKIDGPNVFVDSLLFRTAKADEKGGGPFAGTIWIDDVIYDPAGHIGH